MLALSRNWPKTGAGVILRGGKGPCQDPIRGGLASLSPVGDGEVTLQPPDTDAIYPVGNMSLA